MLTTNPFSVLSETVPSIAMQSFVIVMGLLVVLGTLLDIIHKKNVKYFFENAKKAKKSALSTAKYLWNFLTGMAVKHNIPMQTAA